MTGKPTWMPKEIAFIRAALFAKIAVSAILVAFLAGFPDHNPKHKVTESSIYYLRSQYINREEFNPDIWLAGFPGKKGYLLALYKSGYSHADIIKRIEQRYPHHRWPGIEREEHPITKDEAVEIAVATYHDYASYYGKASPFVQYQDENEFTTQQILDWYRQGFSPDVIRHSKVPPMDYDDVIFILTCFAPGFADSYLSNPQVVVSVMLPGSE